VGSAESEEFDQELDSVLVGPINVGSYKIVVQVRARDRWPRRPRAQPLTRVRSCPCSQAEAPDPAKIPQDDLLGVTVVILSCMYRDKEFVRIGYYVSNEYADPELRDNPPPVVELDKVVRNVLQDKPRVTKYDIPWD
jgi:histone chaperone ASF1